MNTPRSNAPELDPLRKSVSEGDLRSWGEMIEQHRDRLKRMVTFRLDPRLQGRVDASDVIQETLLEAWTRLPDYLNEPKMPFFLWLRFLTGQKLVTLHRHHLGTKVRDAAREVSIYRGTLPEASSAALAARLMGQEPRPSEVAVRAEVKIRLQEALNRMDETDREVLCLRHFEQLSRAETAAVLGMQESAVSKRYVRALVKLKEILRTLPGMEEMFG